MNYLKVLSIAVSLNVGLSAVLFATVYSDGENGNKDKWSIYDNTPAGATISSVYDNEIKSNVIKLEGSGRANSYEIGSKSDAKAWNNKDEKIIQWQMKSDEKYKIYIYAETIKGVRYFYYSSSSRDKGLVHNKYVHYGLGKTTIDGKWHTYKRDLNADLKKYEPDNKIVAINGMRVQGSVKIDDITLTNGGAVVIEPPEENPNVIAVPNDYATLESAVSHAKDGDTIILDVGEYHINNKIRIAQNNLTIASKYKTTGDISYIDRTIIIGNNDKNQEMFDATMKQNESHNLKFIGLTVKDTGKFAIFNYGNENLVDHCNISGVKRDSVSFDEEAGGKVTNCIIKNSGDDAIDVDSRVKGSFEFSHNQLLNSHDDGIEIHLWKDKRSKIVDTMQFDIHDNLIQESRKDGIQLIDFFDNTNRTFNIYNNKFIRNGDAGVGAIFELTNHKKAGYKGTAMAEFVNISNNIFDANDYHIIGGDNMKVESNEFKNAKKIGLKRVKGKSVIVNNSFSNNQKDLEDSNK